MNIRNWKQSFLLLSVLLVLPGCPDDADDVNWSTATIERTFATPEEAALIDIAEHACPARDTVLAVAALDQRAMLEAEAGDGCLWWYDFFDGEDSDWRVPYAITSDAIDYYKSRIDLFVQGGAAAPYAYLDYSATIAFQSNFTAGEKQYGDVYLVDMSMYYSENRVFLGKHRSVVITAEGEVLAVFGDGVSHPYDEVAI